MPERWHKRGGDGVHWTLPLLVLLLAATAGAGFVVDRAVRHAETARVALRAGEQLLKLHRHAEAGEVFRRGAALAEDLPLYGTLIDSLHSGIRHAECGQAAADLHLLCEQVRPLYGAETLSRDQAQAVLAHCRSFWDQRLAIARRLGGQFAPDLEQQVRADLLDLAILWTDLRVRLAAPDESRPAGEEALTVLDEAEALFGPSCVLSEERHSRASALGRPEIDAGQAVPAPRNAWEHYAVGRAFFRAGDMDAAQKQMDRALELEPESLWPNFWKGSCAFRLGRFDDAVVAFSVCVVLSPRMPPGATRIAASALSGVGGGSIAPTRISSVP